MITQLRNLLTAALCLFAVATVKAQFTGGVEQQEGRFWAEKAVTFKLTDVAATLGTDTATLAQTFDAWQAAETAETDLLFLVNPEDQALLNNYTCDGKGFFMTAAGAVANWGNDGTWYTYGSVDATADEFSFVVAQSDALAEGIVPLKQGDVASANFVLKFNGKEATFAISLTVTAPPTIPEPATLLWQQLNIVGEQTVTVEQKPRTGYDADRVEVNVADMAEAFGVDVEFVADNLSKLLYAKRVKLNDEYYYVLSDSISIEYTAGAPGFWFHAVQDAEGQDTGEAASYGYQADDKFYAEAFELNAETGMLSFNLGQYPNVLTGGEQLYAYIYIVYGEKAYSVRINLNVLEVNLGNLGDYEKAGEETIELEMTPQSNYDTKNFSVDIESIAAALGCDVADIDFYALADDVNFAEKNQEGVGYWYGMDGYVLGWGPSAMVYLTPKADDFSRFGLGQYPGHLNVGDELSVSIYFLGNAKYYKLTVHLTVVEPKQVVEEFVSVARRAYVIQQVPVSYEWTPAIEIPMELVEESIGTTDYVVYGLAALNEDGTEKEGLNYYTKDYTCTPYPGFWLDAEGRNNGWNSNARIGITASEDIGGFSMMQYQDEVCKVGDVFKTQLFLVNEENGKMVTFDFVYQIVESVVEYETVGTETLVLPVATEQEQTVTFDMSKAAEALNIPAGNLFDGEYLRAITDSGLFGEARSCEDGVAFNKDGFYDFENGLVELRFEKSGNEVKAFTYGLGEIDSEFSLRTQFCFEVGEKRYVYDVHFVSEAVYAGIQDVNVKAAGRGEVYDLSGRKVSQMAHGVYIVDGRKVVK